MNSFVPLSITTLAIIELIVNVISGVCCIICCYHDKIKHRIQQILLEFLCVMCHNFNEKMLFSPLLFLIIHISGPGRVWPVNNMFFHCSRPQKDVNNNHVFTKAGDGDR